MTAAVPRERSLALLSTALTAYRNVVVNSPEVPVIGTPRPVRRDGYDHDVLVDCIEHIAEDVVSVAFTAPDYAALPAWTPGAHLDVFLPSGRQRQYSLCGDPADKTRYRIAVRRIAGGSASSEIHDVLRPGDTLRIRGPRNAFPMIDAPAYLFVAGGIGITPILPMFRAAARRGVPATLVYTGRTRVTMPFLPEIGAIGAPSHIMPDDEYGTPDLAGQLQATPRGAAVYVCGPPPMLDAARSLLPVFSTSASLHTERFSAPPVRGGTPFHLTLARTGASVDVAADETALAAVRRVLPGVAYSCQQGFCGSCKTRVLCGDVEHRDRLLTESERHESMLLCISRSAAGPLVLDL